jgi:hypothetical protein
MSDDEKDLFGGSSSDGNDTDDLLATANKKQKPIARKKKSRISKTSKLGMCILYIQHDERLLMNK